jgi:histidinol dehydrogenase
LAAQVLKVLPAVVGATAHSDRVLTALAGQQSAIVLVEDIEAAIRVSNDYATEHLEIHTVDNESVLQKITNAGAIFMGNYSPVSLGDYMAGSSHVLPTGQQAKFGSGLGVHSFLRPQQIIDYSREGLEPIAKLVQNFANAEGLPAHGEAVSARFE